MVGSVVSVGSEEVLVGWEEVLQEVLKWEGLKCGHGKMMSLVSDNLFRVVKSLQPPEYEWHL